ncbi:MAG: allantoicase [Bradymonadia bacterium]
MTIITDLEPRPLGLVDLAAEHVGGEVMWCSDEFFAAGANLLKADAAIFDPDRYTERGKWMDGWESRRRRTPGHDTAYVKLGIIGQVRLINMNTAHFTGNYPAFGRVWGCYAPNATLAQLKTEVDWTDLTGAAALKGGSSNMVVVRTPQTVTHLKFDIFPAGGVARLRLYGDPDLKKAEGEVNLIAQGNGAQAIACSDMYFSEMHNLLKEVPAINMGDGWETKRSRPPGDDWVIIKLGDLGVPSALEIDTAFFKGNFPQSCAVDSILYPDAEPWQLLTAPLWTEIITNQPLGPDQVHRIEWPDRRAISHIRLRIYPDGGISRLRLYGQWVDAVEHTDERMRWLNSQTDEARADLFSTCCGSTRWVSQLARMTAFVSEAQLRGVCESIWWNLDESDWLEAFTHHPKIGEDKAALKAKFSKTAALSASEQKGIDGASESVLNRLVAGNKAYLEKFGFIFIVCAQGKSAEEMCQLLESRLNNHRDQELRIAAGEQAKITWLRLQKVLDDQND